MKEFVLLRLNTLSMLDKFQFTICISMRLLIFENITIWQSVGVSISASTQCAGYVAAVKLYTSAQLLYAKKYSTTVITFFESEARLQL